jgi:hypothetical protein
MKRQELTFRVFVSSTFSDLKAERDALQQHAFPRLRKYCEQHNARFQAIDLRWGVSEESALDQKTMEICFQELERCQELSPKPNFIILLGQRYGWLPLPTRIPSSEFEELLSQVEEPERELLLWKDPPVEPTEENAWYARDDNARPELPGGARDEAEYVLRPRRRGTSEEHFETWQKKEEQLREILLRAIDKAGWTIDDPRRAKYTQSATHQEIECGALKTDEPEKHVHAYIRTINNCPTDGTAHDFVDCDGSHLESLLNELAPRPETGLCGGLPEKNVYRYRAEWKGGKPESDLQALCERVYDDLKAVIDEELAAFTQQPDIDREREAHQVFGDERCAFFKGREDQLSEIASYLDGDSNKPLVVSGASGSGKTALMARARLMANGEWPLGGERSDETTYEKLVLTRFIGATPASTDLRSLLRSLCEELGFQDIPQDMNDLVRVFRERLSGQPESGGEQSRTDVPPTVVFLDALDQLNDTENAHRLYWLPRELAPGVKLVLSVLEPEPTRDADADGDAKKSPAPSPFFAHPCELAKRLWPDSQLSLSKMSRADGSNVLTAWLDAVGRGLIKEQTRDVLDKLAADGRPLYLKLAFEEARIWHSWEGLPCGADQEPGLGGTVEEILTDLLFRLEQEHSKIIVERALGSLAVAKNGLTEDELLDLLSRDPDVYLAFAVGAHHLPGDLAVCIRELFAEQSGKRVDEVTDNETMQKFASLQNEPAALRRYVADRVRQADQQAEQRIKKPADAHPEPLLLPKLPVVLWSRLNAAIKPYMTQRRADGTQVLSFYHRQVNVAVKNRYLNGNEHRISAHRRLSEYFAAQDYWAESLEAQRARAKRLPPTPRPANIRKVVELPYHVLEVAKLNDPESKKSDAAEWDAVANLLTDWQFLEAKAEADPSGKYAASAADEVSRAVK